MNDDERCGVSGNFFTNCGCLECGPEDDEPDTYEGDDSDPYQYGYSDQAPEGWG